MSSLATPSLDEMTAAFNSSGLPLAPMNSTNTSPPPVPPRRATTSPLGEMTTIPVEMTTQQNLTMFPMTSLPPASSVSQSVDLFGLSCHFRDASQHYSEPDPVRGSREGCVSEIHLRTTGRHLSMGSHSVICHPTEVTAPPSPQPLTLALVCVAAGHTVRG